MEPRTGNIRRESSARERGVSRGTQRGRRALSAKQWRLAGYGLCAAGTLVWAWRGIHHAALPYEDGSCLFQRYYQELSPSSWLDTYAGYASVLPNVLGSLICRLPVPWIPCAMALTAWLLMFVAVTRFLRPGFGAVAPVRVRAVACASLACLPIGEGGMSTMVMTSQFSLLLWLYLVVLYPRPGTGMKRWIECTLVALLTWSHPLSVLALPLSLLRLRDPRARAMAATQVLAAAGYLLSGREAGTELLWHQLATGALPFLLVRVGFDPLFGSATKAWLWEADHAWLTFVVGAGVLTLLVLACRAAWPRWHRQTRGFLLAFAWLALANSAAALLTRRVDFTGNMWGHRYVWIACVGLVFAVVLAARSRWSLARIGIGLAVWVAWLSCADRYRYRVPRVAPEFRAFVSQLVTEEQRLGGRRAVSARLHREDWPIEITPR
ncbi:MAG TPA: hypothetical protein VF384_15550 [Planctomycetota bacterium]